MAAAPKEPALLRRLGFNLDINAENPPITSVFDSTIARIYAPFMCEGGEAESTGGGAFKRMLQGGSRRIYRTVFSSSPVLVVTNTVFFQVLFHYLSMKIYYCTLVVFLQ